VGFADRHCARWPKGRPPLSPPAVAAALGEIPGWSATDGATRLTRRFTFTDFTAAMAFVDALARLATAEDHHPDFSVRWNLVEVVTWTHDAGGLTDNDFILAARLDALPEARPGARP
jgi:4a-hydroxytetrahydrobiopterin dehydratase